MSSSSIIFYLVILTVITFFTIIIGGLTRLTGSGLSIVSWDLVTGILPPINDFDWQELFTMYQTSPEYKFYNFTMTVNEFKNIFWLEYIHRMLARLIGIGSFALLIISMTCSFFHQYRIKFLFLNILIALQGFIGWYMVKSGLYNNPHVNHLRLMVHLLLGMFTYCYLLWLVISDSKSTIYKISKIFKQPLLLITLFIIIITICYGALTAGLKAGLIYNSFPLMGETIIPEEWLYYNSIIDDIFYNSVSIQFLHRFFAIFSLVITLVYSYIEYLRCNFLSPEILFLVISMILQLLLGIVTLIFHVPVSLAIFHQIGALITLTAFIFVLKKKSEVDSI